MLGILLIDKPLGCSSHDVVNTIRRKLGTKRVGHAGTLDPLGTGLLVVAVGPATRFLQYLPLEPKEYEGTILFGKRTSTYDMEGEVVSEGPVPEDLVERVRATIPQFLGLIDQLPPMHSAVKVAGKPLYKYARKGEDVERQTRTIHISSIEIFNEQPPSLDFRMVCSGGTYVRTLADDLGQAIGCGAHLTRLRRTRVGRFSLEQAVSLEDAGPEHLIPLLQALDPMPVVQLDEQQTHSIREGRQVALTQPAAPGLVALADTKGRIFSVARLLGNVLQPECVIPGEALDDAV